MNEPEKHPIDPAQLAAFYDDARDDPACRRTLDHLTTCPACRERLARYAALSVTLHADGAATPSPSLDARVAARIADRTMASARPAEPWWGFLGMVPLRAVYGAAILVFVLAAIIFVQPFGKGPVSSPNAPATPEANSADRALAALTTAPTPPSPTASLSPGAANTPLPSTAVTLAANAPSLATAVSASTCEIRPVRGFGLLYSGRPKVAARIGCPTGGERGLTLTVQRFENGRVFRLDDRPSLALRADGKWIGDVNPDNPDGLGRSTGPAARVSGAIEDFQHGTLIWTEDRNIAVLYADGDWEQYADEFVEVTPTPANASVGARSAATVTTAATTRPPPATPAGPVSPAVAASCPTEPVRGFGLVYRDYPAVADRLGCANGSEVGTAALQQSFERGVMIERQDLRQIFVIRADGTWAVYPDSYKPGQALADVGAPPSGRSAPVDGFGLLWRAESGLREQLGWATAPAEAVDGAAQSFAGGQMLWTSKRAIYALYSDGTSRSFEDTFVDPTPAPH